VGKILNAKICNYCKQTYLKPKYISKKNWEKSKYCSRICYGFSIRGKLKPRNKNWQKNNSLAIKKSYQSGKRIPYWQGKKRPEFAAWFKEFWANGNMDKKRKLLGSKNPSWKGDLASYSAIHKWLNSHYVKKNICEFCGLKTKTEFALKRTLINYSRNHKDYWQLCSSCHKNYDNLKKYEKF
jgi:hypothetical protein